MRKESISGGGPIMAGVKKAEDMALPAQHRLMALLGTMAPSQPLVSAVLLSLVCGGGSLRLLKAEKHL